VDENHHSIYLVGVAALRCKVLNTVFPPVVVCWTLPHYAVCGVPWLQKFFRIAALSSQFVYVT